MLFNQIKNTGILVQTISSTVSLYQYEDILMLLIDNTYARAIISLQGAQLLSFVLKDTMQDILWASNNILIKKGSPIRGGIQLCFPWFASFREPYHGYARISDWEIRSIDYDIENNLIINLYLIYNSIEQANIKFILNNTVQILFENLIDNVEHVVLHSYFRVPNVAQISISGLSNKAYDKTTKKIITTNSEERINSSINRIYQLQDLGDITNLIKFHDEKFSYNHFQITHINASDIILWNPWKLERDLIDMQKDDFREMICLETGRINKKLKKNESVGVKIEGSVAKFKKIGHPDH